MGNNIGCCRRAFDGIEDFDLKLSIFPTELNNRTVSTANLLDEICFQPTADSQSTHNLSYIQHISDREPESEEIDPSLNLGISPGFQTLDIKSSRRSRKILEKIKDEDRLKRCSSCSTVYIGNNTITKPELVVTLKCISYAIAIFLHRSQNLDASTNVIYTDVYLPFDERKHPIKFSSRYRKFDTEDFDISKKFVKSPANDSLIAQYRQNQSIIYAFLNDIFHNAQLGPECAICSLILFERLITSCELAVLNWTWRRQLFICIVISSKILDDQAIWNADYCQILKGVSVDDLNSLERHVLQLLQFNINVNRGIYIKYYFELMALGNSLALGSEELTNRKILDSRLAAKLNLVKTPYKRDKNSNHGYIFNLSFPYLQGINSTKNKVPNKKTLCDLDILSGSKKSNVKVDQEFLDSIRLQKINTRILQDLQRLPKVVYRAEQVASITSTSFSNQQSLESSLYSPEKPYGNSHLVPDEAKISSTEIDEFEDDYKYLLQTQKAKAPETNPDWSKVGIEFF